MVIRNYLARTNAADERGLDAGVNLNQTFERGSVFLAGEADFGETDSASGWTRLDRAWGGRTGVKYELARDLTLDATLAFERRFVWAAGLKTTYDDLGAGCSLNWPVLRWFTVGVAYDFNLLDTDGTVVDDYTEHQLSLKFSAAGDLLRWP